MSSVFPSHTNLPPSFFSTFSTTPLHIAQHTITPNETIELDDLDPELSLFDDLHQDHSISTNADLLYETLYLAHHFVPGWNDIPFEDFIQIVQYKPLAGGYTNLLFTMTWAPELLSDVTLQASRPNALQTIITATNNELGRDFTNEQTRREFLSNLPPAPAHATIVLRIYGTSAFTDRASELALATLAAKQGISETIFTAWRHGRITSFIDGSSLGTDNWGSPIFAHQCGYLLGQIHASRFSTAFQVLPHLITPNHSSHVSMDLTQMVADIHNNVSSQQRSSDDSQDVTVDSGCRHDVVDGDNDHESQFIIESATAEPIAMPIPLVLQKPSLQTTLRNWYKNVLQTKLYLQNNQHEHDPTQIQISSVFNMFNDLSNELYVIRRPAVVLTNSDDVTLKEVVLPLPQKLAHILVPLLNAQHCDVDESLLTTSPKWAAITNETASTLLTPVSQLVANQYQLVSNETTIHHDVSQSVLSPAAFPPISPQRSAEDLRLLVQYLDVPGMLREIEWLLAQCQLFPLVTSHNDFHSGNVLLVQNAAAATATAATETNQLNSIPTSSPEPVNVNLPGILPPLPNPGLDSIKVIDFEYCGLNYRGFDLGNSLNETWITYGGAFPGFSLDIPGWLTRHLFGNSLPAELTSQDAEFVTTSITNALEKHPNASFDALHTTCPNMDVDMPKLNNFLKYSNSSHTPGLDVLMQRVLLGQHAREPLTEPLTETLQLPFRPLEIIWARSILTGYYNALKAEEQEQHTTLPAFQSTIPSQPSYDKRFVLPPTLDQWLTEQTPRLLHEAMLLSLASMLAWSFWGFAFTESTAVEFGYLEHCIARLIAYVAKKELLMKLGMLPQQ